MRDRRERDIDVEEALRAVVIEPEEGFAEDLRQRLRMMVETRAGDPANQVNGRHTADPSRTTEPIRRQPMLKSRLLPAFALILLVALAAVTLLVLPNLQSGEGRRPQNDEQGPAIDFQPSPVPTLTGTPFDAGQPEPLDGLSPTGTPVPLDRPDTSPTPTPVPGASPAGASLGDYFAGYDAATFVLLDAQSGDAIRYNPARAAMRFSPNSTFKVPAALIGLETGAIPDADTLKVYNSALYPQTWLDVYPYTEWGRDHTLRSAMRYSVNWYFTELAQDIGAPLMEQWVRAIDYGNADTSSGLTAFWMSGSLQISANEQIAFMRDLYDEKLPLSSYAIKTVKDIIILEETDDYRLSGKTGTGYADDERWAGWLVGYFEIGEDVYFFAMNMEGADMPDQAGRVALVKDIMTELRLLP